MRRVVVHFPVFPSRRSGHTSKPKPFMQDRYCSMVDWQSFAGSAALEKSMHSSRFDFSSLQTQQGYSDEKKVSSRAELKARLLWSERQERTDLWLLGGRGCWRLRNTRRSGHGWVGDCQRVSCRTAFVSVQCLRVDTCDPIVTWCDRVVRQRVSLSQE